MTVWKREMAGVYTLLIDPQDAPPCNVTGTVCYTENMRVKGALKLRRKKCDTDHS